MATAGTAAARGGANAGPWWDPFRFLWRLFTSVRFAFLLTGSLAAAGLLGVVIPQVPIPMRGNDAAIQAWLQLQQGKFGVLTDAMYRVGLFNVFETWWFRVAMGVLVVSVTVCTANRLPPTLRNAVRPRERVPDTYFAAARSRLELAAPVEVDALEHQLRRRRYKVKRFQDADAVYVFADRYPWAQLATFASHLGLIVVLAGVVVTLLMSRQTQLMIGEGTTQPVGGLSDPRQMQVRVVDAVEGRDAAGHIIDYHTDLVVYRNGVEACRGRTTVNSPLGCLGYRFHQSVFNDDGAQLTVADVQTGRTLYDETALLTDTMPLPEVAIRDAVTGDMLFQGYVPLTDVLENAQFGVVRLPDRDLTLLVGVRPDDAAAKRWSLVVFELGGTSAGDERPRVQSVDAPSGRIQLLVPEGKTAASGGLQFAFPFLAGAPATVLADLPDGAPALLQLPVDNEGRRYASIVGLDKEPVVLQPGESREIGGRRYTFQPRDFSGITARRDPGSKLIWVAGALLLGGLVVTFYAPRRRLWAKITPEGAWFAGVAERTVNFRGEMRRIARDAGGPADRAEGEDDDDDGV